MKLSKTTKLQAASSMTFLAVSALLANAAQAEPTANIETTKFEESTLIRQIGKTSATGAAVAQNVTSVSQLSDVRPTDWAFTSLQSLVERYGCIAGYPDKTYRGAQALTRYEFAAGLNACLDKVNEIISAGLADKVSKEDLTTLQKLQEEFAAELSTLRGRVDTLESKTAKLEAQQFSTTTKLTGEAIVGSVVGSDGTSPITSTNAILATRVRLRLNTSFSGKDLLVTRLQASNVPSFNTAVLGSGNGTRLSFDGQDTGVGQSQFGLNRLYYTTPVGDWGKLFLGAVAPTDDFLDRVSPFGDEGQTTISRFARFNPVLRINGNPGAIAGLDVNFSKQAKWQIVYAAPNVSDTVGANNPSNGLTGGNYIIATQLVYKPSPGLDLGVSYANSYSTTNSLGSSLNQDSIVGGTGGIKANTVAGNLVWRINKFVTFNTWGSYTFADAGSNSASTTFTSWLAGLSFPDLLAEGNLGGVIFGQPLYRNSVSGGAAQAQAGAALATPYHLEAFYRFRVSKNISITPGVFFVFNPDSNSNNGTATVGVIRTTFTF